MADWTDEEKLRIWDKATMISLECENAGFRQDRCGAWIKRNDYGDRQSKYGWEIDHIKPDSKGGEDVIGNARPLHWENNASRQAGRLKTVVTSKGNRNVWAETGEEFVP